MSKAQVVKELHRPARRNFIRRRTIIKGFDDLWQADLAEFTNYAKVNRGNKYILVVIDCYSKFVWTKAIKEKSAQSVGDAFKFILSRANGRIPKNLQTDQGKEFYNTNFNSIMKKQNINHYSSFTVKKAAIVERVIRTLKEKIYKLFSLNGNYNWINILEKVTNEYNNRIHRTIGMKPKDVNKKTKIDAFDHLKIVCKQKFKVGDLVRISKSKHAFAKGYTPNWTTEIFKIRKVHITNPTTYLLDDYQGNPISGGFYEQELQKTKQPDIFLVEKVLRKKGPKILVKWLGFDNTHNSWINSKDVV